MIRRRNEADGRSHRRVKEPGTRSEHAVVAAMKPMAEAIGEHVGDKPRPERHLLAAMKPMAEAIGEDPAFCTVFAPACKPQ